MTILGISVGTTKTGVCVLKDGELLERYVHVYPSAWSDNKMRIILNGYKRYIQKYEVNAIVVKIPPLEKHTPAVRLLMRRIEKIAKRHKCTFDLTTKKELKYNTSASSTVELIRCAKFLYPVLSVQFPKGTEREQRQYKKLFEAVLSAHFFRKRLQARALKAETTTE